MKAVLFLLLILPSFSCAAPEKRDLAKSNMSISESRKSDPLSKKDPSAVPCIPQKTQEEKLEDLAKLETPAVHSTNCPAAGAIKTSPGDDSQTPGTQPSNPVEVR